MKRVLQSLFLLLFVASQAIAQERTVTGTVTAQEDGMPLPGVSVKVTGTTSGTTTDMNGKFALNVPTGSNTLSFSFIGYTTLSVSIPSNNIVNAALVLDAKELSEVVVTAQGGVRTRNELPFAAQQVQGEAISKTREPNFINSLGGKVSGLSIQRNNNLGGSTNVIMRGTKSLFNNNQALFVVDGIPISNANTNTTNQQTGRGGYDYGNAAADVNPDDIAAVTVLKGAAATALYGSRGANGVILISTKKGNQGMAIAVNNGVTMGFVDKSTLPVYQNQYGAGYGPYYGPGQNAFFNQRDMNGDGVMDLVVPFTEDASYGAPFDPSLMVYQWNSLDPTSPMFGKATPWVGAANNPNSFFEETVSVNNSVMLDGASEKGFYKLGYTRNYDSGILANSDIKKNMANFAGSFNVNSKLTTSASINFTQQKGVGRYGTGYSSFNPMQQFRQWWQTNVDLKEQKEAYERNSQNITWNTRSATDLRPIYSDNPYWVRYQNFTEDERNRYFGNASATYKIASWFDIMGRISIDSYDEVQQERNAVGSTGTSSYTRYNRTSRENNFDVIANFNKDISDNFSFKGLLGTNIRRNFISSIRATTNGGLVVPKLYSLSNSINPLNAPVEREEKVGVDGVFASTTFGYKQMLFMDLTARRDESTTLPADNNAFYYPSAALSFTFSELMKDQTWLSYGKTRFNYAEVGNDAPALSLFDAYDKPTGWGSTPIFSLPGTKNNSTLRPERTKSLEGGIEMAFWNSMVGFDLTYYNTKTIDGIIPVAVSASTGFNSLWVNSGEVENKGFELSAFVSPVRSNTFTWTINANFSKNKNTVLSLYDGVDNIPLTTYQGGMSSNATVGRPFGMLRGQGFIYNNGQREVDSGGHYKMSPSNTEIGNPNPDWIGGIANTLNYKGIGLSFLVDIRKGGDVFSLDTFYGFGTGLYPETTIVNDLGNPSRLPISQGGGLILPGVKENGQPNDIRVENSEGLFGYGGAQQAHVYDASYVKLREVSLSYSLPSSVVSKLAPFKGIDFSLLGRNLWIIHKNLPYDDPENGLSAGNLGLGYLSGSFPTTRNVGLNVRFKF